jgi:hypothetical protein
MALYDTYRGVQEALPAVRSALSAGELVSPMPGVQYPATVPPFREMQRAAPEAAELLSNVYRTQGGNAGVRAFLQSAEGVQLMQDPRFASAAESYVSKIPGFMSQVGKVVGPLATGALRALGPVGLAYDVAAPYLMTAEEQARIRANPTAPEYATNPYAQTVRGEYPTQAAAGAANRRMAIAGQQYGGVTPQEQMVLDQDRLTMMMRLKAAKKVLGQP